MPERQYIVTSGGPGLIIVELIHSTTRLSGCTANRYLARTYPKEAGFLLPKDKEEQVGCDHA